MSNGRNSDIRELLLHIRAGSGNRQIECDTGVDRRTVKRYRGWAKEQCLLEEPLPPLGELLALLEQTMPAHCPLQNTSSVEPYRDLVAQLVEENVEIAAIRCRLEERGYTGSYSAVRRFVRKIKPRTPEATMRVERKPGEEAQVDFGYAGRMIDPVTEAAPEPMFTRVCPALAGSVRSVALAPVCSRRPITRRSARSSRVLRAFVHRYPLSLPSRRLRLTALAGLNNQ